MKWFKAPDNLLKYLLLLENSQEIVLFFDMAGRITDCSTYTKKELGYGNDILQVPIGNIFKDAFIYEDYQFVINERFQGCIQETVAYRKNLTCFPVSLKVTINHSKNSFTGICTAVNIENKKHAAREISALKKELNNTNKISSELVAKVGHELRTPLNGIMGFASNLMEMELGTSQREAVNIINKCSGNMNSLINELMEYTMLINHKMTIEEKEFGFFELIRHIVDFNIGSINEKGLKLLVYVSNDIPDRLIGDELRLTQVLNNLFSNAIKFTQTGQISLEVMKLVQTEYEIDLLFMLVDTGIGIDREDMNKLFHSFSQIDSSINRKYGGTGLGLSICKMLVEAMRGTISVDSDKNKGSTFSFTVRLIIPPKPGVFITKPQENEDYYEKGEYGLKSASPNSCVEINEFEYLSDNEPEKNKNLLEEGCIDINNLLENIVICIELDNWEKAEQLAASLKDMIPKYQYLNSKEVLRLLFAIRRENHDISLSIIKEIGSHTC